MSIKKDKINISINGTNGKQLSYFWLGIWNFPKTQLYKANKSIKTSYKEHIPLN